MGKEHFEQILKSPEPTKSETEQLETLKINKKIAEKYISPEIKAKINKFSSGIRGFGIKQEIVACLDEDGQVIGGIDDLGNRFDMVNGKLHINGKEAKQLRKK